MRLVRRCPSRGPRTTRRSHYDQLVSGSHRAGVTLKRRLLARRCNGQQVHSSSGGPARPLAARSACQNTATLRDFSLESVGSGWSNSSSGGGFRRFGLRKAPRVRSFLRLVRTSGGYASTPPASVARQPLSIWPGKNRLGPCRRKGRRASVYSGPSTRSTLLSRALLNTHWRTFTNG